MTKSQKTHKAWKITAENAGLILRNCCPKYKKNAKNRTGDAGT